MNDACKYWDCGWCYAPDNVGTSADAQSACVNPSVCPYLGWTDTDQHPLTDELLQMIGCTNPKARVFDAQSMRTAADWQLDQVMKWLNETILERGSCLEAVNIPEELAEAMRPTTQENNQC